MRIFMKLKIYSNLKYGAGTLIALLPFADLVIYHNSGDNRAIIILCRHMCLNNHRI